MTETEDIEFAELVNRLAQEVAQAQRQLGAARQKLLSTTRSLEMRTQELGEAKASVALLLATLDVSGDGILAMGSFGRALHFNSRFAQIWGIPQEKAECLNDAALLALQMAQVRDPQRFLSFMQLRTDRPDEARTDVIELTDSRILECRIIPQRLRGRRVGSVTWFRDVTGTRRT